MSIRTFTPLRQTIRAYSALLNISDKISSIEAAMGVPKAAPRPRSKFDIHDRQGLTLLLDRGSIVDRALIDSDAWEREQLDYLFHLARRAGRIGSMTFVDVGAYFGLYSLLALRTGLFDRIHAFEADRDNFAQLQANLLLNDATHAITAANMAVTDTTGTIRFRDSRTHPDGNRAGVGILASGADSYPAPATSIGIVAPAGYTHAASRPGHCPTCTPSHIQYRYSWRSQNAWFGMTTTPRNASHACTARKAAQAAFRLRSRARDRTASWGVGMENLPRVEEVVERFLGEDGSPKHRISKVRAAPVRGL